MNPKSIAGSLWRTSYAFLICCYNMTDGKKGCVGRMCCVIHVALNVLDTFTDCSTVIVYWRNEALTVFVLALLSLVISLPVSIARYFYQFKLCTGKIDSDQPIITLKLVGMLLESLPQLMLNLYILARCEKSVSTVQWVSAAVSFLTICLAIIHYDISARVHETIGLMQKIFITFYRVSYLAARILAMIYFVYVLQWWIAAVMTTHWLIGLFCVMRDKVETVVRSLVFVFLNSFIYIGEFGGVSALFVLILYVMENIMMIAIAYIVWSQAASQTNDMPTTTATPVERITDGYDFVVENDFAFVERAGNVTDDESSHKVLGSCPNFGILAVHIGLNVFSIAMCCLYNVSLSFTVCNGESNGKTTDLGLEEDELQAEFQTSENV